MKFLVYSDVHGNLPAFKAVLNDAKKCDGYICLGDLVDYGPCSNECVDLALSLPNSIIIMGNHEEDYINGKCSVKTELVNKFFNQTYPAFNRKNEILKFIGQYNINDFTLTHTINGEHIYINSNVTFDKNYIIGHSHHQFKLENDNHILYNAGSVGQNRKYINVANYIIFDSDENKIEMKSLIYDILPVINKMTELNYPAECVQYYTKKERLNG